MSALTAWLRVAMVDLRGDLRRFGILLACLALGVATIAIVGSVGASLQAALDRDARLLLGGDLEAGLSYRKADEAERAVFDELGTVTEVIEVMGNGRRDQDNAFLSLKAIDANYPLIGDVNIVDAVDPEASPYDLLALRDGAYGMAPESLLFDRLGIEIGDRITVEGVEFEIRGVLSGSPDAITQTVQFGIPTLITVEALDATNILQPGVLARYRYKVLLEDIEFADARDRIRTASPDAGWGINSPRDSTDDIARFFNIFSRFLTIVGLSALIVGGVGVSNAVAAYITERQRSIATLKALGATSTRILTHFLAQVVVLTFAGIVLGLVLGAAIALAAIPIVGSLLGINLPIIIDPASMAIASAFGLLVGFTFAFLPLKRAQLLRPAMLFRAAGTAVEGGLRWRDLAGPSLWIPLAISIAAIYALALFTTNRPELVFWYAIGVAAAFIVLRLAGALLQRVLRLVPSPPNSFFRNALKAIHRPGAPAPVVILSLGLGLALLVLIALIDNNLRHQLDREQVPPDAPNFVYMDLFEDEVDVLAEYAATEPRIAGFESTAMIRGAVIELNGEDIGEVEAPSEEMAMAFDGDEFPLTASGPLPPRSTVVEGEWWGEDYEGDPLASVYVEMADALGIEVGDELTFRIYGEEVRAKVANLRDLDWRGGGVSFAFVLTPNIIDLFPVSYLGLLRTEPGAERDMQRELVENFPELAFFPVSEALDVFSRILDSVTNAVAVIGGLAVISGLLVLAGAMVAGRRQREADAVVMKVLGATRRDIIFTYLIEYGLLGALAAIIAAGLSVFGAWAFVELVLELDYRVDPLVIIGVIVSTVALTIAVGVATTWSALSIKPSGFLREE